MRDGNGKEWEWEGMGMGEIGMEKPFPDTAGWPPKTILSISQPLGGMRSKSWCLIICFHRGIQQYSL